MGIPARSFLDQKPDLSITEEPLWPFHQALSERIKETKQDHTKQSLWTLAIIKSLLEISINKLFIIEAIDAFTIDLASGAYYANGFLVNGDTRYSRNASIDSVFNLYRQATGNAQGGDEYKGHILRTTGIRVSALPIRYEYLSNDLLVTFKDKAGLEGYLGVYQTAWQEMLLLSKPDRDDCIDCYIKNIKVELVTGCVNERSGTALLSMLDTIKEKRTKLLQRENFIKKLEPLTNAWFSDNLSLVNHLFNELLTRYDGYTFYENEFAGVHYVRNPETDKHWVINNENTEMLKHEIIAHLVKFGETEKTIYEKWPTLEDKPALKKRKRDDFTDDVLPNSPDETTTSSPKRLHSMLSFLGPKKETLPPKKPETNTPSDSTLSATESAIDPIPTLKPAS